MTLEKLLLFGFALACVAALAAIGRDSAEQRVSETGGYRDGVETIMDRIP